MRLLVVKFAKLRGALATTAAFRSLRERHPGIAVTCVTTPPATPALDGCPAVVDAIGFEPGAAAWPLLSHLRRQRFDAAIALGAHPLARRLVALSGARRRVCAGRAPLWWRPFFHQEIFGQAVDPHEAACDHEVCARAFGFHAETPAMWFSSARMQEHGLLVEPRRYAVLHPACAHPGRWLALDKWAAVARELLASGLVDRIVVSAGREGEERIFAEALCGLVGPAATSTGGRLGFAQLARLIKDARLFLGVDSSILQLAAAVGTPVVGVFGPSDYARARPWGTLNRVVRVDTAVFEGEAKADYEARLSRAFERITPRQIVRAAEEVARISA
jgi:ADP-heptose:LPS heptosyltransferase